MQNYTYNIELKSPIHIGIGDTPPNLIRFIKSNGRPFIPGSEVKGAIRTAVLYEKLKNDKDLFAQLVNKLKAINSTKLQALLQDYKSAQTNVRSYGKKLGEIKESCMKAKCITLITLMNAECSSQNCSHFNSSSSAKIPLDLIKTNPRSGKKDSVYCKFVKEKEKQGCKINLISRAIKGDFDNTYSFNCAKCGLFSFKDIRNYYISKHTQYINEKTNRDNKKTAWEEEKKNVSEEINKIIDEREKKLFHVVPDDIKTSLFKYLIVTDSELFENSHIHNYQENITPQSPNMIKKEYLWDNVTSKKIKIKIFDERISVLFQNDTAKEKLSESSIVSACKEFAVDKIAEEINYFTNIYPNVKSFYANLNSKINSSQKYLKFYS